MTDDARFERRLQERLVARAALASRSFDPHEIAEAAVVAGAIGRLRPSPVRVRPLALLVAAALLVALAAATLLATGSTLRWDQPRGPVVAPMGWTSLSPMTTPRAGHTATLLADGRVLVAGGRATADRSSVASAEIYDPATTSWTATGPMTTARADHQALLLPDGRVVAISLITRSWDTAAETWDPSTGEWSAIGEPRRVADDAAALLPEGRVLVAGGLKDKGGALLDPATGTWTETGPFSEVRYNVDIVTLLDGTLLLVGGDHRADRGMTAVERFDASGNTWSVAGRLRPGTHAHAATLLDDGRILVVGAEGGLPQFAQLFDPASGQSELLPGIPPPWAFGAGARLADGRILFASSEGAGLYDPASRAWLDLPPMPVPRVGATMTSLESGAVLVVGGEMPENAGPSSSVELYGHDREAPG